MVPRGVDEVGRNGLVGGKMVRMRTSRMGGGRCRRVTDTRGRPGVDTCT